MSNQIPSSLDQRGTVLNDGTEFGINHNYADHIVPPEVLDKKRQEEALLRAAKIAAGNSLAEEAVSGVSTAVDAERKAMVLDPEIIANFTRKISENMQEARSQEIDLAA